MTWQRLDWRGGWVPAAAAAMTGGGWGGSEAPTHPSGFVVPDIHAKPVELEQQGPGPPAAVEQDELVVDQDFILGTIEPVSRASLTAHVLLGCMVLCSHVALLNSKRLARLAHTPAQLWLKRPDGHTPAGAGVRLTTPRGAAAPAGALSYGRQRRISLSFFSCLRRGCSSR